jgi:hypothetical protein
LNLFLALHVQGVHVEHPGVVIFKALSSMFFNFSFKVGAKMYKHVFANFLVCEFDFNQFFITLGKSIGACVPVNVKLS